MLKVTVRREQWFRGRGPDLSMLRQKKKRNPMMCCLGFAMLEAGYEASSIAGQPSPAEVMLNSRIRQSIKKLLNTSHGNSNVCSELMHANDNQSLEEKEREDQLQRLGREAGIEFIFVD